MKDTNVRAWRAANYGTSKMRWFVCRPADPKATDWSGPHEYLRDLRGVIVKFGSYESAQRRAEKLERST